MVRVRILDERLVTLQRQGRIGFHIGSIGEEAAILGQRLRHARSRTGSSPATASSAPRSGAGMPLQRYIDNMFGNANDPAKGRQMPDHYTLAKAALRLDQLADRHADHAGRRLRLGGASSSTTTLAALVYFGDGATSSNDFHNGLNFAGVFKTPVVFFCRNNGWAISVPDRAPDGERDLRREGRRLRHPRRALSTATTSSRSSRPRATRWPARRAARGRR